MKPACLPASRMCPLSVGGYSTPPSTGLQIKTATFHSLPPDLLRILMVLLWRLLARKRQETVTHSGACWDTDGLGWPMEKPAPHQLHLCWTVCAPSLARQPLMKCEHTDLETGLRVNNKYSPTSRADVKNKVNRMCWERNSQTSKTMATHACCWWGEHCNP